MTEQAQIRRHAASPPVPQPIGEGVVARGAGGRGGVPLSEDASYITGSALFVDGGLTAI